MIRLGTPVGPVDIVLHDQSAPRTVANFLSYVRSGAYDSSFFHRLVRGFVLQGGGLRWSDAAEPQLTLVRTSAPVANEFSAQRSNLRGTVAMAKVDGDPDSATSQWFVNLADNSANLDRQNGGFTVFGRVTAPGMAVVDALAGWRLVNASGCTQLGAVATAMGQTPMASAPANCEAVTAAHLALISTARELPTGDSVSPADRVFQFLEASYPQWVAPASVGTQVGEGFVFRHYPSTQTYLGVVGDQLYALAPAVQPDLIPLGPLAQWLQAAATAGY